MEGASKRYRSIHPEGSNEDETYRRIRRRQRRRRGPATAFSSALAQADTQDTSDRGGRVAYGTLVSTILIFFFRVSCTQSAPPLPYHTPGEYYSRLRLSRHFFPRSLWYCSRM